MKTMAVAWNGTTLNDKVKLLSVTEIGYSNQYAVAGEGNRYYSYLHIKNVSYWLRSRNVPYSSSVWFVRDDGYITRTDSYSETYSLAPVIRLG